MSDGVAPRRLACDPAWARGAFAAPPGRTGASPARRRIYTAVVRGGSRVEPHLDGVEDAAPLTPRAGGAGDERAPGRRRSKRLKIADAARSPHTPTRITVPARLMPTVRGANRRAALIRSLSCCFRSFSLSRRTPLFNRFAIASDRRPDPQLKVSSKLCLPFHAPPRGVCGVSTSSLLTIVS